MARKAIVALPALSFCILILIAWKLVPLEEKPWVSKPVLTHGVEQQQQQLKESSSPQFSRELELAWKKHQILNTLRSFPRAPASAPAPAPNDSCAGKRVYIYKLPSKFNKVILHECQGFLPWYNMCGYFRNSGMGVPVPPEDDPGAQPVLVPRGRWFRTHQYALEYLFHQKLLHYPCLTDSPAEATLFYIPFYAGLDVLRYHYTNESLEKKNELGLELIRWLQNQELWKRNGGRDHLLVMGKITWDFRRNNVTKWGNTLLKMPELENPVKLLLERDPWEANEVGVPHPTYFHPGSDSDIRIWINRISSTRRRFLVSFAGMPRDPDHIRSRLIRECDSSRLCKRLACAGNLCDSPRPTMKLFMSSHFCMQPPGDSATRRSVFDSLIAGCIPVLFDPDTAYFQYPWHLPEDSRSFSVFVSGEDVKTKRVSVVKLVESIPEERVQRMRSRIINEIVPGLLYSQPGARLVEFEDAFDISLKNILSKVQRL